MTWSFATARVPATFAAAIDEQANIEHAAGDGQTLCGLDLARMEIYRHLFGGRSTPNCPDCAAAVAAAPTEPSYQERLHDRVLAAEPSRLRDDLLAALRGGAELRLGINGPAAGITRHYAQLDRLAEGRETLAAALSTATRVIINEVVDGGGDFVVVQADGAPPVLGRRSA
ncbi:hypothetical protein [Kutzneria chonburiensis]|uniref:Uncharacterized protein n=1 Tax=Kutzneria chonburiensis TaxID=1483604 RepID=A0ABV6N0H0_9PSEU|nr:hypothetical protein [Kutzneria chonburiensis]